MRTAARLFVAVSALLLIAAAPASASRSPSLFSGSLLGDEPQAMTPATLAAAMNAELARRYGARWTAGTGKWSVCPDEDAFMGDAPDGDETFGTCQFRFQDGVRWRHGEIAYKLVDGDLALASLHTRTFTKALKTCHIRPTATDYTWRIRDRHLRADGYVSCSDGPTSMARQVQALDPGVGWVGLPHTYQGPFADAAFFRCVVEQSGDRRSATCANKLGDRFVYRYAQRARPRR